MNINKLEWFTLVELIVAITILTILATLAFVSFQGYSMDSRDTKRLWDIATVSKGLQVYLAANNEVPNPSDSKTVITYSGSELLTQWYAWKSVLNSIRVNEALDPVDKNYYTYATNKNNTKFQILAFLEKSNASIINLKNNVFANYSERIIYSAGQTVWIFIDISNIPVQALWNSIIELRWNTDKFKVIFSKNTISQETDEKLYNEIVFQHNDNKTWRDYDPHCKINDIEIGNQVWAWCNSTLWEGIEFWQSIDDDEWEYNWLVTGCYNYSGSSWVVCIPGEDPMMSYSSAYDWNNGVNNNWDSEYDTIWWKFYRWENSPSACPNGRHVPSDSEFIQLETYLWCNSQEEDKYRCDGLGWSSENGTKDRKLTNLLKIPLAWHPAPNGVNIDHRWYDAWLWTSDEANSLWAYRRNYQYLESRILRDFQDKRYGFSVRCIKD